MNPSALIQLPEQRDAETALAVLDSLSDALFLIEPNDGVCRPINRAAVGIVNELGVDASAKLSLEQYFPDFDFSACDVMDEKSQLAHFPSGNCGSFCDVHIQFRQLPTATEHDADHRQLLAIVRRLGVNTSSDSPSPRDAFDDAFHDPLTRLPNRLLFARRLERAIRRRTTADYHFAVLFVDLDRFKAVNDRFGHLLGDRLLVSAAHRLVETVRPQDMVARRDGDEFTILLDDLDQSGDTERIAERIAERLAAPFLVETANGLVELSLGASIGVALPGNGRITPDELLAQADAAMYQAKSLGGGTFAILNGLGSKPRPR